MQSEARFRAVLDSLLDPFVLMEAVLDGYQAIIDFRFTYANEAAYQATRLPKDHFVGQLLSKSMPEHFQNGLFERFCQVMETGAPLVLDGFEFERNLNGERSCLFLDIRATRMENGLSLTWRDGTERRRMLSDLTEVQSHLVEGIETERKNLAQVLHDGPIQDLYAVDYQLHGLQKRALPPEDQMALDIVQGMLHRVIGTLLTTVAELRPMTLAPFGLHAAIRSHVHDFSAKNPGMQITLDLDEDGQLLSEVLRLGLFRIYQQVTSNIHNHADATCVGITLKIQPDEVLLRISDNGVGFIAPPRLVTFARSGQLGLASAYEQTRRLGGEMLIESQLGDGTCITIRCPN